LPPRNRSCTASSVPRSTAASSASRSSRTTASRYSRRRVHTKTPRPSSCRTPCCRCATARRRTGTLPGSMSGVRCRCPRRHGRRTTTSSAVQRVQDRVLPVVRVVPEEFQGQEGRGGVPDARREPLSVRERGAGVTRASLDQVLVVARVENCPREREHRIFVTCCCYVERLLFAVYVLLVCVCQCSANSCLRLFLSPNQTRKPWEVFVSHGCLRPGPRQVLCDSRVCCRGLSKLIYPFHMFL